VFRSLICIIAALGLTVISTIGALLPLAFAILALASLVNLFGGRAKVPEQKSNRPLLPQKGSSGHALVLSCKFRCGCDALGQPLNL
jgi:hypothetical protein